MTKAKKLFYFIAFLQAPKLFILIYFNHLMPIFRARIQDTHIWQRNKKSGEGAKKNKNYTAANK